MRAVKIVTDPKAMELLGDETRRRIIYLLRGKEMSVNQLAAQLEKTPQAIYHQIKKLGEAELVEVTREERSGHLVESYYRATAEIFNFQHGQGATAGIREAQIKPILNALKTLGLVENADDETVAEVAKLQNILFKLGEKPGLEQDLEKIPDLDFFGKQGALEYSKIVIMTDEQFQEFAKTYARLREILKSPHRRKLEETMAPAVRPSISR